MTIKMPALIISPIEKSKDVNRVFLSTLWRGNGNTWVTLGGGVFRCVLARPVIVCQQRRRPRISCGRAAITNTSGLSSRSPKAITITIDLVGLTAL